LRNAALHSILTSYPDESFPIVTWVCGSDRQSIGTRVEIMVALVKAAYFLSGITHFEKHRYMLSKGGSTIDMTSEVFRDNFINDSEHHSESSEVIRSGKTVIKREAKLRQLKKRTIIFRNEFCSKCSDLCFYPVLNAFSGEFVKWIDDNSATRSPKKALGDVNATGSQQPDEITAIVPAQALLSLGAFVRCSTSSPKMR
jgi:hypothetical protein